MSGAGPESERERQLRIFAGRVLSWPDPNGPSTVDLLPRGYPEELPPELVDDADLRFLGSVVRRRAGELLGIELLFEMAGTPHDLLVRYEQGLERAGWQRVNQPGLPRGGFQGNGPTLASTLVNAQKRMLVYIQSFSELNDSVLRAHWHAATDLDLQDELLGPDAAPGRSPLPGLKPPPGVRVSATQLGGGGGRWTAEAKAQTEVPSIELEAHFAKELEAAGWSRLSGSADDLFAWSSWLVPSLPPSREWRGTLIVVAAFPGERSLSLWAEETKPR